jgi:hypothetical protein
MFTQVTNRSTARALRLATIAGSALAASAALAGPTITVTPIVVEGDIYNGFPISSGFSASENHAVNDLGQWVVESDTTNPDTNTDGLVVTGTGAMGPRSVLLTEGQSLMFPAGSMLDSFDAITINNLGNSSYNFFLDGTTGTSDDSGVYFNDMLLIQEGTVSNAAGFSAGTPYIGWFETLINDQNQIMMMASVDDPAIASTTDRAIVIIDNPTGAFTETVIAKEGDELVPGRFVADFSTSNRHVMAFRNNSRILFHADLDGDTLTDGAIFHYDGSTLHLVAQEGSPSAVAGRNWGTLLGAPIDINNSGDWVMRGDLDGGTADDSVIVKNGTQVIAREGDPVPAAVGAFTFTNFGTGGVAIADNGDVIYFATWSDPDTSRNQGIFVNDELVVQKGVTVIEGAVLSTMSAVSDNISASGNGRYIIFEGTLTDTRDGAFLIDRGEAPCPADFDNNGTVAVPDIFAFLAAWFAQDSSADFNGDTAVTVPDIFAFLSAWFAGCP